MCLVFYFRTAPNLLAFQLYARHKLAFSPACGSVRGAQDPSERRIGGYRLRCPHARHSSTPYGQ